jgi:hypothetical protein
MLTRFVVALALLATACDDSANTIVITDDPVDNAVDLGHASGTVVAAHASSELNADNFTTRLGKAAGILAQLNKGMFDTNAFAAGLVAADDSLDFANNLVNDYADNSARLDEVVRIYGVPYINSDAQAQLAAETSAAMSLLRNTPQDEADVVYMTLEVTMLAESQVVLDEVMDIVGPGNMADYIIDTRAMVDGQLDEAGDILAGFFP